MRFLLCVFLFWGLLCTATSLKCLLCTDKEEDCFNTSEQKCKRDEDACVTAVWEETFGTTMNAVSFRGCMKSESFPPGYHSMTLTKDRYSRKNIAYCKTDLCNDVSIRLPHRGITPNGLQCPSCLSLKSDTCDAKKTVNCISHENRCIYYVSTVTIGGQKQNFAYRGCATDITCGAKPGRAKASKGWFKEHIKHVDCY